MALPVRVNGERSGVRRFNAAFLPCGAHCRETVINHRTPQQWIDPVRRARYSLTQAGGSSSASNSAARCLTSSGKDSSIFISK